MRERGAGSWLVGFGLACGPTVGSDDGADGTSSSSTVTTTAGSATSSSSSSSSSTTSDDTTSTTSTTADESDTSSAMSTACPFVCGHDVGDDWQCDQWAQDCPPGEKCIPFTSGEDWYGTHCIPVAEDPAGVGEPCIIEGVAAMSVDNCEAGAMCFDLDPDTGMGTCYALCQGSEADGVCEDPASQCVVQAAGPLILCYPSCDPLAQACDEGDACYPLGEAFTCVVHAEAEGMSLFGDPCEFTNVCDPGLFCASPDTVPDCAGSNGCCNAFCDLEAMDPDAMCPAAAQGQSCAPWYEDGMAPPGLAHVGYCTVMP